MVEKVYESLEKETIIKKALHLVRECKVSQYKTFELYEVESGA